MSLSVSKKERKERKKERKYGEPYEHLQKYLLKDWNGNKTYAWHCDSPFLSNNNNKKLFWSNMFLLAQKIK